MAHSYGYAKRLMRGLPTEPRVLVERPKTYGNAAFLDLFFPHLLDLIYRDPQAGLHWSQVAPDLAFAAPEEPTPEGRSEHRTRLVKAQNILGSAFRACGRHDESEAQYRAALSLIASESVEPVTTAETYRNLAYLRDCQGRSSEALEQASVAVGILREVGSADRLAHALLAVAYVLDSLGQYSQAFTALGEALQLCGKPDKSCPAQMRLHASICTNMAYVLPKCQPLGDYKAAFLFIRQAKKDLRGSWRIAPRYFLLWVEGLAYVAIGSDARAVEAFRAALAGFRHLEMPYETGLCAVDLGDIYRRFGEWNKLEPLARDTFTLFELLAANTAALRAMSQWRDAAIGKRLTEEITATARELVLKMIGPGGCCKT